MASKLTNIISEYNPEFNYIGNKDWQYKITNHLYKHYSAINYTAYWHDIFYGHIMHEGANIFNQIVLKILFDIVFIVMVVLRSIAKFQIKGAFIGLFLGVVLLLSTPWYFLFYK